MNELWWFRNHYSGSASGKGVAGETNFPGLAVRPESREHGPVEPEASSVLGPALLLSVLKSRPASMHLAVGPATVHSQPAARESLNVTQTHAARSIP